ncbi:CLUMA_CG008138, isoform A [Clunio marinus]|uniref:CLUMA_CG008138, isoform A n=1 Tax=Clunio marinus TaxID=568069 RepID=A0A1J1I6R5_9DIPT|nr:CLUMA_CG008138, isoform A [Clunio marinus]
MSSRSHARHPHIHKLAALITFGECVFNLSYKLYYNYLKRKIDVKMISFSSLFVEDDLTGMRNVKVENENPNLMSQRLNYCQASVT